MTPVTDAEIARRYLPEPNLEVFQAAIANGTGTGTREAPNPSMDSTTYVHDNTTVYTISSELTEDHGVTEYVYTVELDPVEGNVQSDEVVAFEDLSAIDQEELAGEGFESVSSESDLGYGFVLEYTPDERNQSALVPSPSRSVIEWDSGVQGRLRVVDSRSKQTKTYQYTATEVGTLQEVGKQLRERFAFDLSGLSTDQREIVQTAIDNPDGYMVKRGSEETGYTPSAPVRGLSEMFAAHSELNLDASDGLKPDDTQDTWPGEGEFIVRYESEAYWVFVKASYRWETQSNS